MLGILAAVARRGPGDGLEPWYPEERLPLVDVLQAYTHAAAVAGGWQNTVGSLAPGKRADFVVLDRDLFSLAGDPAQEDAIAGTSVLLTVVDGSPVYHDPGTALL
jgi:predicted amidohydrolase YtcJ